VRPSPPARLGLALGGGASRGFAHLGVIRALEEAGCPPAAVAGTSIGAIIGGLWAAERTAEGIRKKLVEYISSQRFREVQLEFMSREPPRSATWRQRMSRAVRRGLFVGRTYLKESFIPERIYREHLVGLLPEDDIEALPVPFAAMASDLITGRAVSFRRGNLHEAVLASGSIPGVMPPLPKEDMILVDGVATDRVPVRALLEMDVDVILAVDVGTDFKCYVPPLRRGVAIHGRAQQVTEWSLREIRRELADVVLWPDVAEYNPLDFYRALPAVDRGYEAAMVALPGLRRALRRAGWAKLFGRNRLRRIRALHREGRFGAPPIVV
jgi:NTE family protein